MKFLTFSLRASIIICRIVSSTQLVSDVANLPPNNLIDSALGLAQEGGGEIHIEEANKQFGPKESYGK